MGRLSELDPETRQFLVDQGHAQIFLDGGEDGLKYLRNRGISEKSIKRWNLGFCPSTVNDLIFSNRVVVPYYDTYDKLVAVSVRRITSEKPTWWNERFTKSNYLFGLNKAKESIFKNNLAIITEGQFDVISTHQRGLNMTVGLCGSSLDEAQITLLSRYCNRFVLAFDVDDNANQSGQKASAKAFEMLKDRNIYLYRWFLPKGYDPDEYVRMVGGKRCINQIKEILKKYSFKDRRNLGQKYYYGES